MTSQGSADARFRRALATKNRPLIRAAAAEPPRISTAEAAAILLVTDGSHARTDGFVSLGVIASALVVAAGFELGDPLIGLGIGAEEQQLGRQGYGETRPELDRVLGPIGLLDANDDLGHDVSSKRLGDVALTLRRAPGRGIGPPPRFGP